MASPPPCPESESGSPSHPTRVEGLVLAELERVRPQVTGHYAAQIDVRRSRAERLSGSEVSIVGSPELLECVVLGNPEGAHLSR